jgi:hypothetical protein
VRSHAHHTIRNTDFLTKRRRSRSNLRSRSRRPRGDALRGARECPNVLVFFLSRCAYRRIQEAKDKTVRLPDDSPLNFESFVFWLYHGELPAKAKGDVHELADAWVGNDTNTMTRNLMHVHIFSDKYGVADLSLETLTTIFLYLENPGVVSPLQSDVYDVYEALSDTGPLCQFLIHLQCATPADTWKNSAMENWHPLFLRGVLSRYAMLVKDAQQLTGARTLFRKFDLCDYHGHGEKEERVECKKQLVKKR